MLPVISLTIFRYFVIWPAKSKNYLIQQAVSGSNCCQSFDTLWSNQLNQRIIWSNQLYQEVNAVASHFFNNFSIFLWSDQVGKSKNYSIKQAGSQSNCWQSYVSLTFLRYFVIPDRPGKSKNYLIQQAVLRSNCCCQYSYISLTFLRYLRAACMRACCAVIGVELKQISPRPKSCNRQHGGGRLRFSFLPGTYGRAW